MYSNTTTTPFYGHYKRQPALAVFINSSMLAGQQSAGKLFARLKCLMFLFFVTLAHASRQSNNRIETLRILSDYMNPRCRMDL